MAATRSIGASTGTINRTSTSADLSTLGATDGLIQNVAAIGGDGRGRRDGNLSQTEGFTITGSANADTITGGSGADTISAGGGNDTIVVTASNDVLLDGGAGTNTLDVGANFTRSSDGQVVNIQNVTLTAAATLNLSNQSEGFNINGSSGTHTITGGSGSNTTYGQGGATR